MIEIRRVDPRHLGAIWPHIEPIVMAHVEWSRGEFTAETCIAAVHSGQHMLWAAYDTDANRIIGLVATQDDRDGSWRPFTIIVWTQSEPGRLGDWGDAALAEVEARARELEHYRVVCVGRKGWAKTLMRDYRATRWLFEKELAA